MTPERRQKIIEALTEWAQGMMVSDDPSKAIKGRFVRDVLLPAESWMFDELGRLDNARDQSAYAEQIAHFVGSLAAGTGVLIAMGVRPIIATMGDVDWKHAEELMFLDVRQNYQRSMRAQGGMPRWPQ